MQSLTEDDAVVEFARAMGPFLVPPFKPAFEIVRACQEFYRNVRIVGAEDSMLLECGQAGAPVLSGFHDYRAEYRGYDYEPARRRFLEVRRQILTNQDDNDTALSVTMYFHEVVVTDDNWSEGWFAEEFWGIDHVDRHIVKATSEALKFLDAS